ncbi:MAG: adenine phosphoribosyltransferase [Candidatus Aenigmatarchaeota archaeon]
MNLKRRIRDIPNFPKEGIMFKDINPLLRDPEAFQELVRIISDRYENRDVELVAGIESRGFIIGGALANELGVGFVPIRKKGKLPGETFEESYEKEYGSDSLEIQMGSIKEGQKVLVVDDLLATGGTAAASAKLVEKLGGKPLFCFVIELYTLHGIEKLRGYDVFSLLRY